MLFEITPFLNSLKVTHNGGTDCLPAITGATKTHYKPRLDGNVFWDRKCARARFARTQAYAA
jgi:hypothetical protein